MMLVTILFAQHPDRIAPFRVPDWGNLLALSPVVLLAADTLTRHIRRGHSDD